MRQRGADSRIGIKDFKRLVRARMRKTGESYTSARAQLLNKKKEPPALAAAAATRMKDYWAVRFAALEELLNG